MILYKYARPERIESMLYWNTLAFPRYDQLNDPCESSIDTELKILRNDFRDDLKNDVRDDYRSDYKHIPPLAKHPVVELKLPGFFRMPDAINPIYERYEEEREFNDQLYQQNEEIRKHNQNITVHNKQIDDHNAAIRVHNDSCNKYNLQLKDKISYLEYCRDKLGMLSLSTDRLSVVMWAHYADNHKGLCIGINVDHYVFSSYFPNNWHLDHHALFKVRKIEYKDDRPIAADCYLPEYVERAFFTKHSDWKYEKEYRILRSIDDCHFCKNIPLLKVPKEVIMEVILGINIDKEDEEAAFEICEIMKLPTPNKVKTIQGMYKLTLDDT